MLPRITSNSLASNRTGSSTSLYHARRSDRSPGSAAVLHQRTALSMKSSRDVAMRSALEAKDPS